MTLYKPCIKAVGPANAKIAIVGEAPGETEEQLGVPFVGASGNLLDGILRQADLTRAECYLTNVLWTRPPNNKLEAFCVEKADIHALRSLPSLSKGLYLHSDFACELQRLRDELIKLKPNLIVACGNTAAWALLRQTAISKIRGTIVQSDFGKVLPTYHPAAIFRQWDLRPVVVADFIKAKNESAFPEVKRPAREIIINPSFGDIAGYYELARRARAIACDIETQNGQITCIGFAINPKQALVIPFVDHRKPDKHYWQDPADEILAMRWTAKFLELPQPKIFQNGLYDLQYLRKYRFRVVNCFHDTMLLHHALHPELLKGLGFMGSVYTNEPAWKLMRQRGEEVLKRDE